MRHPLLPSALALVAASALLASCGLPLGQRNPTAPAATSANLAATPGPPMPEDAILESAGQSPAADPAASVPQPQGSYRPDEKTAKERVPDIIKRGRLIVGVDRSNNLMSYRDTATGEVRGFEVDIAREIARDIFGDPSKVDFRFVDASDRATTLRDRTVDIVIRTMTISAERQREVAFSIPYMTTNTRILALKNSGIDSIEDTAGKTLCAVQGSTPIKTIRAKAPQAHILEPRTWGDCLMSLQLSQSDAIVADDALLSGMLVQDSYSNIVGDALGTEDYGVAIRKPDAYYDSKPLIRQVNSTLERIRKDGTWARLFAEWLGEYLEQPVLPSPNYLAEEPATSEPHTSATTSTNGEAQ